MKKHLFTILITSIVALSGVKQSRAGGSAFINASFVGSGGGLGDPNNTAGKLSSTPGALIGVGADFTSFGVLYYGFEFNGGANFLLGNGLSNITTVAENFSVTGNINGIVRLGFSVAIFKLYAIAGVGTVLTQAQTVDEGAFFKVNTVQMNFGLGTKIKVFPFVSVLLEAYAYPNLFFNNVDISNIKEVFGSAAAFGGRIGLEISF